jgi:hypothetical protein
VGNSLKPALFLSLSHADGKLRPLGRLEGVICHLERSRRTPLTAWKRYGYSRLHMVGVIAASPANHSRKIQPPTHFEMAPSHYSSGWRLLEALERVGSPAKALRVPRE